MKILITGCRGQLGTELQHQLSAEGCAIGPLPERLRKATVIPVDVDELDITDREATINYIRRHQPDTVINCAAFTNVDGCETARDAAFKVNAIGPRNLALACEKVNARLIHISTDYVFPGTANGGVALDECAVPAPISAYGQTKLLGEQYVERFCRRHFIVRTAWLYSSYGKNFVKTMIRLGRTHDKITVVNDQLGNPTNAVDLAYHILKLAVSHDYGIYHCTGNGICSWYDFACAIMQGAGLSCAGFIGSNFVHYMLEKYEDIRLVNLDKLTYAGNLENLQDIEDDARHIFVQGDICDKALVTDLIAKYDPDYVINFAAESHVDRSIKNPEIFVESNVLGTVNLLQCCKDAWYDAAAKTWKEGKKYLQVSTDEVYGALGAEGYFMETTPLCPHSPYSASKASADMFVKAFHDTYGMPMNITRCSNNYGPYQFPEKLIPLLINNAKQHKTLPVYGDGMQIRDWLYVMDHCKAIDMVANGGKDGEVYNVGGHNERPNIFIVKTVIAQLHDRLKDEGISEELITHVADRLGHDRRYGIDPTKIKEDLGWYPETPFEKGIVLTIDWYLAHPDWMAHVTSGDYQKYYEQMYKNK